MFQHLKLITLSSLFIGAFCAASGVPETVRVPLSKAYIPVGFDDNDRAQVVVEGSFPNTCYRVGPHKLTVDKQKKVVAVEQMAYRYKGVCLQMAVPFTQTIDVGLLAPGAYTVTDATSASLLGSLPVEHTDNPAADNYLYAPITDAYVVSDPETKTHTLVIAGSFNDRCTTFEEIRVNQTPDVIVVQPIVQRKAEPTCATEKVRFLKTYELQGELSGLKLIHVRSLNGQAINRMVDF